MGTITWKGQPLHFGLHGSLHKHSISVLKVWARQCLRHHWPWATNYITDEPLVAMRFAASSFLFLVVRPGALSSVLAPSISKWYHGCLWAVDCTKHSWWQPARSLTQCRCGTNDFPFLVILTPWTHTFGGVERCHQHHRPQSMQLKE